MDSPNTDFKKRAIVIFGIAFLLILGGVLYFYGAQGIFALMRKLVFWVFIASILVVLALGIYWLLKKQKLDLVHIHRQRIIEACKANGNDYRQQLFFRSVGDNWNIRPVGDIVGLCMIKSVAGRIKERLTSGEEVFKVVEQGYDLIFVTVRPPGLLHKWFGGLLDSEKVIGGVPADYTNLSASVVYLNGMTFSPPLFGIMFLSHHWDKNFMIDETITQNIYRYQLAENLKELATMMEDAIDASPSHKKKQEIQNIQQVPVVSSYAPK